MHTKFSPKAIEQILNADNAPSNNTTIDLLASVNMRLEQLINLTQQTTNKQISGSTDHLLRLILKVLAGGTLTDDEKQSVGL